SPDLVQDGGLHGHAPGVLARADAVLARDEQDVAELDGPALLGLLAGLALDAHHVARSDLELFSAGPEDRVHGGLLETDRRIMRVWGGKSRRPDRGVSPASPRRAARWPPPGASGSGGTGRLRRRRSRPPGRR